MRTQQTAYQCGRRGVAQCGRNTRRRVLGLPRASAGREAPHSADVIVIGAGIVGVGVCQEILQKTGGEAKVVLLDNCQPGLATGAGQGYIWMAHRQVGSAAWDLANWSTQLWRESLRSSPDLRSAIEWQDVGSILIAEGEVEQRQLEERCGALRAAGLQPQLLSPGELREAEPALAADAGLSGLLLETDAQINGRLTLATLLHHCSQFGPRFCHMQPDGAAHLLLNRAGDVTGVVTCSGARIEATSGVVVAAGSWGGALLAESLGDEAWRGALQPRKGHLLEVQQPEGQTPIRHGLMECGYTSHYVPKAAQDASNPASAITFTATTTASGSVLLGSSREMTGFQAAESEDVMKAILQRAAKFIPGFAGTVPQDSLTRVGLRPYSPVGPVIGSVPRHPGLFLAGGHEGSGLALSPATSKIIAAAIFGGELPKIAADFRPEIVLPELAREAAPLY